MNEIKNKVLGLFEMAHDEFNKEEDKRMSDTSEDIKIGKLKPCPFCGGEVGIIESKPSTAKLTKGEVAFSVMCSKFKCNVKPKANAWQITKEDAVEAWNTRADSETIKQQQEVIDELKDAMHQTIGWVKSTGGDVESVRMLDMALSKLKGEQK